MSPDTKPTPEQIEAAKWVTRHFLGDDVPSDEHMDADLLSFLATREARVRAEAKAEAFNRAAQKFNDLAQLQDMQPEKGRTFLEAEDWCREFADDEIALRSVAPKEGA